MFWSEEKNMKWVLIICAMILVGNISEASSLNQSTLKYADVPARDHIVIGKCAGTLPPSIQIKGIGDQELTAGTPCLAGDFDGNGFLDFAFFRNLGSENYEG